MVLFGASAKQKGARISALTALNDNYFEDIKMQKAIECSKTIFDKITKIKPSETLSWKIVDKIALLTDEIQEFEITKKLKDFCSLTIEEKLITIYKHLLTR